LSQSQEKNLHELTRSMALNPEKGLTEKEAVIRLNQYGKNSIIEEKVIHFSGILGEEITEP
jgi:hypothetical protein